jgi:very-long-chain enoyl-CoA reductase
MYWKSPMHKSPAKCVTVTDSIAAPKKPIKKLPTSIEITDKTTVQDVKDKLAKQAGGWDPNRFGLFDPVNKKILKDRKALISQQKDVISVKEVLVKDLGMP